MISAQSPMHEEEKGARQKMESHFPLFFINLHRTLITRAAFGTARIEKLIETRQKYRAFWQQRHEQDERFCRDFIDFDLKIAFYV